MESHTVSPNLLESFNILNVSYTVLYITAIIAIFMFIISSAFTSPKNISKEKLWVYIAAVFANLSGLYFLIFKMTPTVLEGSMEPLGIFIFDNCVFVTSVLIIVFDLVYSYVIFIFFLESSFFETLIQLNYPRSKILCLLKF